MRTILIASAVASVAFGASASFASAENLIKPQPPVCVKGQKDFTRWADATLSKYGLTLICDKQFGGINLKPANSGKPTLFNGKLVRWGKLAPSYKDPFMKNPAKFQTAGFGYYEQNNKLYVETADGTAVYSSWWGLSAAK